MKLIVLTYPEFIPDEAAQINSLFEAGMELLHIRKPLSRKKSCFELLDEINPKYYSQIKIHDFFDLADHFPILGVHLNYRNPVYNGERNNLKISKSCHTVEALKQISEYDYVFLSPIYNSISKPGYRSRFPKVLLQKAAKEGLINEKVFALSGVDETTIPLLKAYPFGGVAILGRLWKKNEDVVSNFLKLKAML
jgi:thiamine-phosphate pyrophosphorylase